MVPPWINKPLVLSYSEVRRHEGRLLKVLNLFGIIFRLGGLILPKKRKKFAIWNLFQCNLKIHHYKTSLVIPIYLCFLYSFQSLPENERIFKNASLKNFKELLLPNWRLPIAIVFTTWKVSVFRVFLVRIRENADQKNYEHGHLSHSVCFRS